jgi:hypothetical protein
MKKQATRECSMQTPGAVGAVLPGIRHSCLIQVPVNIDQGGHSKFAAAAQGVGKPHGLLRRFSAVQARN